MRVLLAFDKFKDSLTSPEACEIVARALREKRPDWEIDACPFTDGGEGFCDILTRSAGGEFKSFTVTGPRGVALAAPVGFVSLPNIPAAARAALTLPESNLSAAPGNAVPLRIAIIEMAAVSGLALLGPEERDPWATTTRGTGELIRAAAAEPGVVGILLGVGGSATNDVGLGALEALGFEFRAANGERVSPPVPNRWPEIARIAGALVPGLPPIRIACDVTNPLLGPRGAAATYGPQKGLRPADLPRLENAAAQVALLLCHRCNQSDTLMDVPGTGAAGGISFGLMAATGATLLPGFDLVTAWLDLERRLQAADVVITGEGRFDDSSLQGKGPGAVAARALALEKETHVFAGAVTISAARPRLATHAITGPGVPLAQALREAPINLAAAVTRAFPSPTA